MQSNQPAKTAIVQPPAQQETLEQAYYKAHPFTYGLASGLFIGLAVGVIAGWWAHWLASGRDDRKRITEAKAPFGIFVQKQIDAVPEDHVLDFYNRIKADLRSEVITLRQYLKPVDRIAFDRAWDNYDKEVWKKLNYRESGLSKELEE
jgi:hypothetical protein